MLRAIYSTILLVLLTTLAFADTDTLYPSDDAFVDQDTPGNNYGLSGILAVLYNSATGWMNTLVKFDLSSYTGMTINNANLRLYVYDSGGAFPTDEIYIARNDTDWTEGIVTWNNKPGFAELVLISAPSSYDWWVIDVTGWINDIADGTDPNYGFQIFKGDFDNDYFSMRSKEYSSDHPELVLDYTSAVESTSLGGIKAVFK